jgi:transposase-like protein
MSKNFWANAGSRFDHVTVCTGGCSASRRSSRDAGGPCRHAVGDCWFEDETYLKVAGRWRYVYRAVDQYGQIIDVYVSPKRDIRPARQFFTTALRAHGEPTEVVTDRAPTLRAVIDELVPAAFHNTPNTRRIASSAITAD